MPSLKISTIFTTWWVCGSHMSTASELGTVKDILLTGGIDLFVVQSSLTGKQILLPAVKEFIKSVNVPAGVLEVDPIPGLFDDDSETAF